MFLFIFLVAANKDSYDQLITKMKHPDGSQKPPVRHNILSRENSDIPYKDCVTESTSTIRDSEKINFSALNAYIENSNTSCSSINPMNFLTVELSSSFNDSNDKYASNHVSNISCKVEPILSTSIVKTENTENEEILFSENIVHKEIISSNQSNNQSKECNTEDGMDIDSKESVSELIRIESENKRKAKLSMKRSRNNTNYSPEKRVPYSNSKDRWLEESRNEEMNLNAENIEYSIGDSDNSVIQNYGKYL